ncbi:MAG TPA: septum formation initiator family protein [Micropepsaceae bacterium]|nr:septum formation initiator family protein [Micropepsaceae bacterium]
MLAESEYDSVTAMRIHRRIGRNVPFILLPAICCAVSGYFGYSFFFGERGLLAWHQTQDELAVAQQDLAAVHAKREALAHRISLLDGKAIDPDLLEEVARGVLLESRSDEVAVPREKR